MTDDCTYRTEQLEAILDHLPALVFLKDTHNRFLYVNKYIADAYRSTPKNLAGKSLYDLHTRDEADKYLQDDLAVISSGIAKLNLEEKWDTPDGIRWVNTSKIPFIDQTGTITGIIGISMDITEKKRSDELILELLDKLGQEKDIAIKSSFTDELTKIPNRRFFDVNLEKQISLLRRNEKPLSILMLDIDYFKKYNDLYGHVAGDSCLQKVAQCIQQALFRPTDFAARFGGEEFMVILPDSGMESAKLVGSRILKNLEKLEIPHDNSEVSPYVTISIGVLIFYPHRLDNVEKIIELVDKELYKAKDNGRNRLSCNSTLVDITPKAKQNFIHLLWETSFQSGDGTVDEQHQELLSISNRLITCLNRTDDEANSRAVFDALINSLKSHFEFENRFLIELAYPQAQEHKEMHVQLLSKATGLVQNYKSDNTEINKLVYFLIIEVVVDHLKNEDSKFFPFIEKESR